ncbi:conserved hypothetical protein [Rhodococcus jostii RHA1]|uniref:Uncharacterized protein n=1 Tax=Rhodococcus jostii (strain RHA1) TaxID=101510 RepID=Q0SA67_RHOJR|nr:hypothetical protein [Rhodococcus jostii]ABG95569.1 conserved hypothetical protein [Rhodococcus jostii RHA1]
MTVDRETLELFSAPDRMEIRLGTVEFTDGALARDTVEKTYDHMDFRHGVNVFLNAFQGAVVDVRRILRLYSPLRSFFDKTWRPSEIERVQ